VDSSDWDERYSGSEMVWSQAPNIWVEQIAADLPPGKVIDLAAGEGRNSIWLAERGWQAVALDFSEAAVIRARSWAAERLGDDSDRFDANLGDLLRIRPDRRSYDLVLVIYLHVPEGERWMILRSAAEYVTAGGLLVVVGHHTDNLTAGVGGPQDAAILFTAEDVVSDLEDTGLQITRAERALRAVETPAGPRNAIDVVVVAQRPQ